MGSGMLLGGRAGHRPRLLAGEHPVDQPPRPQCAGIDPPQRVWCHITGTDLVRHSDGQVYVLEDFLPPVPFNVATRLGRPS